jgi:hypothetical protein
MWRDDGLQHVAHAGYVVHNLCREVSHVLLTRDDLGGPIEEQGAHLRARHNAICLHEEAELGDQDLLDFAAVHTLLNGGTVYAVEPGRVPDGALLVAIFRY